mgnify:FL=1
MITVQILDYVYDGAAVDFNKSIIGNLDVGSSQDFPLALTFAISDIRSLEARTGTYSKTFKIPATKNNNKIFKGVYYSEAFIEGNNYPTEKDCRILVDNSYSVVGKIQLTAVGKASSPSYYSCVFYGNNVDWASSLNTKLLKDLSVLGGANGSGWDNLNGRTGDSGIGLKIHKDDIFGTWEADDAEFSTPPGGVQVANQSPVVYPVVSYGEMNEGGISTTIQLLGYTYSTAYYGWWSGGTVIDVPLPTVDWRPCVFIYDVIKQIFTQEGYTLDSAFIETDMFKKLLMALPNFVYNNVTERVDSNSWLGSYNRGALPLQSGYADDFIVDGLQGYGTLGTDWDVTLQEIKWDVGGQLEATDPATTSIVYDDTTGIFTIGEYGFYDISVENISLWIESVCKTEFTPNMTTSKVHLRSVTIKCQVKTVGGATWKKVGNVPLVYGVSDISGEYEYDGCPTVPAAGNPAAIPANYNLQESLSVENRYLNKGDRVRFVMILTSKQWEGVGETYGFKSYIFGGENSQGDSTVNPNSNNSARISITHRGEIAAYGQTYDLKNVIDSSSSQIDFIKGVAHAFNLQFTTNTLSRVVSIEPFNDFYKNQNVAVDWTDKVDFSQTQEDKWIETELAREIIFKYKTDSNDKVVEHKGITYWDSILDEAPYRDFLPNDFKVGTAVFENPFFAGTFNIQNRATNEGTSTSAPYNAVLWGACDDGTLPQGNAYCRPEKGYDFVPRLLNWNRLRCSGYSAAVESLTAVVQIGPTATKKIWSTPHPTADAWTTIYPQATSYDKFNSAAEILTYSSLYISERDCTTGLITTPAVITKGLYQNYYEQQIEMIKKTPRLKTIYLNLTLSDISLLDLRKLVYIDGTYYRINQIIDFQPNNTTTTKVELVLWEEQGTFLAKPTPGF